MGLHAAVQAYSALLIGRRVATRYLWALNKQDALKHMQRAGEPFLGVDGAREVAASVGFMLLNFDDTDPEEVLTSSIQRLLRIQPRQDKYKAPTIPADVDVHACVRAMTRAWKAHT